MTGATGMHRMSLQNALVDNSTYPQDEDFFPKERARCARLPEVLSTKGFRTGKLRANGQGVVPGQGAKKHGMNNHNQVSWFCAHRPRLRSELEAQHFITALHRAGAATAWTPYECACRRWHLTAPGDPTRRYPAAIPIGH